MTFFFLVNGIVMLFFGLMLRFFLLHRLQVVLIICWRAEEISHSPELLNSITISFAEVGSNRPKDGQKIVHK